jgi:hypothetical protein
MSDDPKKPATPAGGPGSADLDLSISPVVEKLKPQPYDPRRFEIITGYISEVSEGRVRLYLTLDFQILLDIPRSAIVIAEKEQPGHTLSATRLLVEASAPIRVIKVSSYEAELGFLTGSISAEHFQEGGHSASQVPPESGPGEMHGVSPVVDPTTVCHPRPQGTHTSCYIRTLCASIAPHFLPPPKPTACYVKTICVTSNPR